ncbi:MAG: 50S ribosomal protein L29 [Nitrospinae bacterium]|nr:50S ribosomal protein L29 [Nitrospinota bacterium]MBL7019615.1 50S ribosomal protein L29 [Nitrospinaceae bacterium]
MKVEEARGLSEKERDEKIVDINQEIFNLRLQLATGKIENPSRIRFLRRDVARLKTVQNETRDGVKNSAKQGEENKVGSDK